ncbi:alpha-ketoglutarate-dependent dioxygenase AlkB [Luteolibacter ambystomatis]|uniref:Alpha-ketoglutarate-dependent dioxygenase AlkB n=1 Tax=Luteolibacter ambystomatis TaxID=2824561 RepID=A0A975G802_9BACT|nr:alpha-ketoglutarate-dependent dioxygenase AlkB [Luteolibacter ambystomatis]QUE50497.1 alpha-ketoglutarate-dependent dioxygenase AlkB [Luteolibacter ambystomatis]
MDLFGPGSAFNLLPCDGDARYHGPVMTKAEADEFLARLLETIPWRHDELVMFGRKIVTTREIAWFGNPGLSYTYSGTTKQPLPWTAELLELKALAERLSGSAFNSCLLNLYHHGGEGMGWHSDDEASIVRDSAIASLSFGAERKFALRHKRTSATTSLTLANGSLLVMAGITQTHWLHSLPKMKKVTTPRINLTFRLMRED